MIAGGISEAYAPWQIPNNTVTTMRPAGDAAPNKANTITPAEAHMITNRLMGPNLSARKFGMIRPITELALRMATMYLTIFGLIPFSLAKSYLSEQLGLMLESSDHT